jgi:ferredoxin
MRNAPVIDVSECSDCETCLELCPTVFVRNKETGFIEIRDLEDYPQTAVVEVISYCPRDCISLEEDM